MRLLQKNLISWIRSNLCALRIPYLKIWMKCNTRIEPQHPNFLCHKLTPLVTFPCSKANIWSSLNEISMHENPTLWLSAPSTQFKMKKEERQNRRKKTERCRAGQITRTPNPKNPSPKNPNTSGSTVPKIIIGKLIVQVTFAPFCLIYQCSWQFPEMIISQSSFTKSCNI